MFNLKIYHELHQCSRSPSDFEGAPVSAYASYNSSESSAGGRVRLKLRSAGDAARCSDVRRLFFSLKEREKGRNNSSHFCFFGRIIIIKKRAGRER